MKSQNVTLGMSKAVRLARQGGFIGNPSTHASKQARGAFGEALVRGWLRFKGYKVRDQALIIRAEDFGLDTFPSFRRYRMIEIVTDDESLAVEVKTYGTRYVQGTVGDTFEDQLSDDLRWRNLSKGRTVTLAIVNYYGRPMVLRSDMSFIRTNRIPIIRFAIKGMTR